MGSCSRFTNEVSCASPEVEEIVIVNARTDGENQQTEQEESGRHLQLSREYQGKMRGTGWQETCIKNLLDIWKRMA
jgi:hypothetical protein